MPSGGARNRSGPAAQLDALRRERDGKDWTKLPRECTKATPDWPLEVPDPDISELAMWERLWSTPQAHIWHADGAADQVAIYVRTFVEGAARDASTSKRLLLRQQADALYLTPISLFAGRYVITGTPEAEMLQQTTQSHAVGGSTPRRGRSTPSARSRMVVVPMVPEADEEPEEGGDE